jgi:hypothetical protein
MKVSGARMPVTAAKALLPTCRTWSIIIIIIIIIIEADDAASGAVYSITVTQQTQSIGMPNHPKLAEILLVWTAHSHTSLLARTLTEPDDGIGQRNVLIAKLH